MKMNMKKILSIVLMALSLTLSCAKQAPAPGSGTLRLSLSSVELVDEAVRATLADYGIRAEMTATPRVGVHRYTFPEGADGHVIIDLQHGIYNYDGKTLWAEMRVVDDRHLVGYRITNGWARTNYTYFAVELSQPMTEYGYKDLEKPLYSGFWRHFDIEHGFPEMAGRKLVAWFKFDTAEHPVLEMKVALSAVSMEGAMKNLRAETEGKALSAQALQTARDAVAAEEAVARGNLPKAVAYLMERVDAAL